MLSAGSWQKWERNGSKKWGHRFFGAQKHGLICTTGKTMAFESYLPKRGFLKIPTQSSNPMGFPMGFTWFSHVFPRNFMAFNRTRGRGCCKARVLTKGAELRPDPSWWPELGRCHWPPWFPPWKNGRFYHEFYPLRRQYMV